MNENENLVHLSKRKTNDYLKTQKWQLDMEISNKLKSSLNIYKDKKGQYLIIEPFNGKGLLIKKENKGKFIEGLIKSSSEGPTHILEGIFPNDPSYIEKIPLLIKQFPKKIDIDEKILDLSVKSLIEIEKKIKAGKSDRFLQKDIFPSLIAYIGEVIRIKVNGKWEMRKTKEEGIYAPWIVTKNDAYPFFLTVYDQLYEGDGYISIAVPNTSDEYPK